MSGAEAAMIAAAVAGSGMQMKAASDAEKRTNRAMTAAASDSLDRQRKTGEMVQGFADSNLSPEAYKEAAGEEENATVARMGELMSSVPTMESLGTGKNSGDFQTALADRQASTFQEAIDRSRRLAKISAPAGVQFRRGVAGAHLGRDLQGDEVSRGVAGLTAEQQLRQAGAGGGGAHLAGSVLQATVPYLGHRSGVTG